MQALSQIEPASAIAMVPIQAREAASDLEAAPWVYETITASKGGSQHLRGHQKLIKEPYWVK